MRSNPRPYAIAPPALRRRRRPVMLFLVLAVLATIISIMRATIPRETRYEELARNVTVIIKENRPDMLAQYVVTTAPPVISRDSLAQLSTTLAPFGRIARVQEIAAPDSTKHAFLVTFDHGTLHESMTITRTMRALTFGVSLPQQR